MRVCVIVRLPRPWSGDSQGQGQITSKPATQTTIPLYEP